MFTLAWLASFTFWFLILITTWAETAAQGSGNLLESALGSYSSRLLFEWNLPDGF